MINDFVHTHLHRDDSHSYKSYYIKDGVLGAANVQPRRRTARTSRVLRVELFSICLFFIHDRSARRSGAFGWPEQLKVHMAY